MKKTVKIEPTADGSSTIYLPELDEHYHSVKGALTESIHVYRDCAYLHHVPGQLRLLEVGFGTGLNAAVTAMSTTSPLHYISLELYPLDATEIGSLGYGDIVDKNILKAVIEAPWDKAVSITPMFTLEKRQADYTLCDLPRDIDVVYFDAFAPDKQPEMWSEQCFSRLIDVMRPGAVMTTYCAKGIIRRRLSALGLVVERIPGPANGKREILRAIKPL